MTWKAMPFDSRKEMEIMQDISTRLGAKLLFSVTLLLLLETSIGFSSGRVLAAPFAYIANYDDGKVAVLDTATNTITATITVGSKPYSVAITPDQKHAYVPNNGDSTVSIIDLATNTVVTTIHGTGTKPTFIAFTSDGSRAFVTNNGDSYVSSLIRRQILSRAILMSDTSLSQ